MASHGAALAWVPPTGTDAAVSYNVYRSTTSGGPYTKINTAPVTVIAYTDTDAAAFAGESLFYVVTAVDASGNESQFSNQALAMVPGPNAPTGLSASGF